MKLIDLERRLAQIEATRSISAPTSILTDRTIGDPAGDFEAADAMMNWQRWVAQGRATVRNGVLCLSRPKMTVEEWGAAHVTAN